MNDCYTVYDFINREIPEKELKFGWKVEIVNSMIRLRYTALNFDWTSLEYLGGELWNDFLNLKSYSNLKARSEKAMEKFGRLFFEAANIGDLKFFAEEHGLKIDLDALVSAEIKRRAEVQTRKNEEKRKHAGNV